MNGILLMVEVLKRELAPDPRFGETMEDLDAMRRAVLDSVSTMDRFVFAHRLSRGKHQTKYQPFKIKPILNELVSHLAHAGRDRQVEFDVQVDDNLAASSDRDLVRLILQNLLLNTIKHAKRGGGRVRVTGEQRGTTAVLTVTDQGPGISAEQLPSIFTLSLEDPSQGKKAVKLGLPVAKQAADLIGATLKVQSSAEAGSTFTLEIPERRG
jgi:signal transduction histidine kinase